MNTIKQENSAILHTVMQCGGQASLSEISQLLPFELARRTLQRRLATLVKVGQLSKTGVRRGVRYTIAPVLRAAQAHTSQAHAGVMEVREPSATGIWQRQQADTYPPISGVGEEIRQLVRQPLSAKTPVGYRREFLDSYRPNQTFYLPQSLRAHLHATGSSPMAEDRPAGTYAREVMNRLLIDLSWNSSRLEGNTYSLLETERLLNRNEMTEGKASFETQMILNHKAAIEFLVEQAEDIGFNRYTLLNLHALLSDNLLPNPMSCGRLRTIQVGIGKTVYTPLQIPQLIDECFQQILDTAQAIVDPFEQAFFAMVQLPYLQAFEDVNKRVSRLAVNIPLIRHNLCPMSFVDMSQRAYVDGILGIYELNRIELLRDVFVWAYERSAGRYAAVQQTLGDPDPFRMHYRQAIADQVAAVVRQRLNKREAALLIKQWAEIEVAANDRQRFIEVVETELLSLHEGNIARYRIRPGEYQEWQRVWG